MPQRLEHLRAALQQFEAEIAALDDVDDEARELLEQARLDIQEKLESQPDPDQWESQSFIDRLTASEQEFEASHPTISGVVRRLIDALGQMGI